MESRPRRGDGAADGIEAGESDSCPDTIERPIAPVTAAVPDQPRTSRQVLRLRPKPRRRAPLRARRIPLSEFACRDVCATGGSGSPGTRRALLPMGPTRSPTPKPPAGFLAGQLADLGTGHTVQLAEHVLDGLQLVVGEHIKVRGARRHQPVLGPAEEVFLQQFGRPGFDQSLANRQQLTGRMFLRARRSGLRRCRPSTRLGPRLAARRSAATPPRLH